MSVLSSIATSVSPAKPCQTRKNRPLGEDFPSPLSTSWPSAYDVPFSEGVWPNSGADKSRLRRQPNVPPAVARRQQSLRRSNPSRQTLAALTDFSQPTPAVPAVAGAGLAFSQAIRSFRVFAGIAFLLTMIIGLLGKSATGSRSLTTS